MRCPTDLPEIVSRIPAPRRTGRGKPRIALRGRPRFSVRHCRGGFETLPYAPQLVVTCEERDSNAQLSSYRRTRGELRAVRQF